MTDRDAEEQPTSLDQREVDRLLAEQDGVVSRRQLVRAGARPHDIRRMLRRRDLAVVHTGVYVDHTGPPTWQQRAWAAVLVHWPAALARESALPDPPADAPIQVVVDHRRTVVAVAGVRAHRTAALDERVLWAASPPRQRLEHAVIEVALGKVHVVDRFAVLADAVGSRRTTAARLAAALRERHGVADRDLLLSLLDDLEHGATSVLERAYLLLERRHGLPTGHVEGVVRQAPGTVGRGTVYRDVHYRDHEVFVELDGWAFHRSAASRDRDAARDLVARVQSDAVTVRLTHGLVLRDGCATIRAVAALLQRRGWEGEPVPCPECSPPDAQDGATQWH